MGTSTRTTGFERRQKVTGGGSCEPEQNQDHDQRSNAVDLGQDPKETEEQGNNAHGGVGEGHVGGALGRIDLVDEKRLAPQQYPGFSKSQQNEYDRHT